LAGSARQIGDRQGALQVGLQPLQHRREGGADGHRRLVGDELGLTAMAFERHHREPRRLGGRRGAVVLADQVQTKVDTRRSPTAVNNFATGRPLSWFESRVIQRVPATYPGVGRRVYPGFLQHISFIMMNADRHIDAHREFFGHLVVGDGESAASHRRFYDEYNAVLDMAAEYYLETLRVVFKEHALPNGSWIVDGEAVRPADITRTALFTIEGELDDISGVGQTQAAHDLCRGIPADRRDHFLVEGVGHYGIFNGRRWRTEILPQVRGFIRENR
jgi:poly(3-hydroxybutyrate) depolymerase